MAKLPEVTREQVRPEDLPEFDETVRIRGGARLGYSNLLYSPKLAARVNSLNMFFPYDSVMVGEADRDNERPGFGVRRPKLMEVAILATTAEIKCQPAFSGHARTARESGVSEETIRTFASGKAPNGLLGDEDLVVRFALELLRTRHISDGAFDAVKQRFGVQWTVELVGLICYYLMLGHLLMAFEEEPEPGVTPEPLM